MPTFYVIKGDGQNPIKTNDLPSIIHFDIPRTREEWEAQEREIIEHDRRLRGFRGVIKNNETSE